MYTFRKSVKLSLTSYVRQLFVRLVKGGGDKNADEKEASQEGSEESCSEAQGRQEGSEESCSEAQGRQEAQVAL